MLFGNCDLLLIGSVASVWMCAGVGLDGSTSGLERERLINIFNAASNNKVHLFLLSTRLDCSYVCTNTTMTVLFSVSIVISMFPLQHLVISKHHTMLVALSNVYVRLIVLYIRWQYVAVSPLFPSISPMQRTVCEFPVLLHLAVSQKTRHLTLADNFRKY